MSIKTADELYEKVISNWLGPPHNLKSVADFCSEGTTILFVLFTWDSNNDITSDVIERLIKQGASVEHARPCDYKPPLYNAIQYNYPKCARMLIKYGAVTTGFQTRSRTGLYSAPIFMLNQVNTTEMAHILLDGRAHKNVNIKDMKTFVPPLIKSRKRCVLAAISVFVYYKKRRREGKDVAGVLLNLIWSTRTDDDAWAEK